MVELTAMSRRFIEQIYMPVGREGAELLGCLSDRQLELIAKVMRTARELLERHTDRVEKLPKKAPSRPRKAG
jgi:hypothetical protein